MYELWGGGAPFTIVGDGTRELRDSNGAKVRLLGASGKILHELKNSEEWTGVITAWVSCTDEPTWAGSQMSYHFPNNIKLLNSGQLSF